MALKPNRSVTSESVHYFTVNTMNEGFIVAHMTGYFGTGAGLDDANQAVYLPAAWPSGLRAIGMNGLKVVNKDLSETPINPYNGEHQVGDKTLVYKKGEFVTNAIKAGQASGTATNLPRPAYAGHGGYLYTGTATAAAASGWPQVGVFLTTVNSEGYAKVALDLP